MSLTGSSYNAAFGVSMNMLHMLNSAAQRCHKLSSFTHSNLICNITTTQFLKDAQKMAHAKDSAVKTEMVNPENQTPPESTSPILLLAAQGPAQMPHTQLAACDIPKTDPTCCPSHGSQSSTPPTHQQKHHAARLYGHTFCGRPRHDRDASPPAEKLI